MSSMQQTLLNGIAQASSGKELNSDTIDLDSSAPVSHASPDSDEIVGAEESTLDDGLSQSDDAPADSPDSDKKSEVAPQKSEAKQKTSDLKEVITISDDKGRRKVEVDFSNRDQLKKYVQMAYGARKWQAERDQAIQSRKEVETKFSQREQDWQKLEQAFQQGPEHLIDLLAGRKGAFDELVQKRSERAQFLKSASPEEIQALEARELAEKQAREIEKIRRENDDFKKKVTEERDAAELRAMEARIHPAFERYRFAGKLGDEVDEQMFDDMLWTATLKRLEPYEEKGLDLTPELIDKEFRTVSTVLRKRIGAQSEKRATKVVEQKKQEATENVQAKVKSGYKSGNTADEARNLLNNGDLKGLLKNWGKYGSLFRK